MSYPLFDKDEHWHKPEQAFLTDDHRTILRFAVEALMSGKGAVLVTLVEIHGGAALRSASTIVGVPAHANPNGLESQWL